MESLCEGENGKAMYKLTKHKKVKCNLNPNCTSTYIKSDLPLILQRQNTSIN